MRAAAAAMVILALMGSPGALGEDDFPIIGTYLKDEFCQGPAALRADLRIKITRKEIESDMGVCSILHRKRDGKTIAMQLQCKVPGDLLILGDVTFTMRDDDTLDFDDQDHTSTAVLHKCQDKEDRAVAQPAR